MHSVAGDGKEPIWNLYLFLLIEEDQPMCKIQVLSEWASSDESACYNCIRVKEIAAQTN